MEIGDTSDVAVVVVAVVVAVVTGVDAFCGIIANESGVRSPLYMRERLGLGDVVVDPTQESVSPSAKHEKSIFGYKSNVHGVITYKLV